MLTDKEIEQIYEKIIEKMIDNFINPNIELYSPLLCYGGKYYLADKIIKLFSKHRYYVEPFFGGGSVFFKKQPSYVEVINDIDENLINFFKVLRDKQSCKNFLRLIITTPVSRLIHKEFRQKYLDNKFNDDEEKAFVFFYLISNSFNGEITGSFSYSSKANAASRYYNKINKIIFAHQRLANAIIENTDAVETIKKYDTKETLFYLDPPYVCSTRTAPNIYTHEMSDEKHMELIDTVLSSKGMFIISNYDNEIYQKLEKYGYKKQLINVSCHSSYKPNKKFNQIRPRRQEVIWYNTSLSLF